MKTITIEQADNGFIIRRHWGHLRKVGDPELTVHEHLYGQGGVIDSVGGFFSERMPKGEPDEQEKA